MASAFAHAATGAALWPLLRTSSARKWTWAAGAVLAAAPDLDVIGFRYGIAYGDLLGHRGLTHSLFVAALVGFALSFALLRPGSLPRDRMQISAYLFLAFASHGLLDAMTTGGLGVALLAPLDNTRYFFPWRPIAVSPIGVARFFSERGVAVLLNEALWVGLPSIALALFGWWVRRRDASSHGRA